MAVATIGTMKASSADDLQAGGSGNELAFSIVIPIYNEAACLPRLCQELADVLSGLAQRWEVVLVDDASLDRTAAHLADISACCPRIRHYRLSKHR
ncbi:MAG: glycosyltransferase, partial [Planctomycetes bacterium]|nr:glycosyltransferase [Planctomycetota bacterium]